MNGKMYATSQMVTWLYQNGSEDPFERMERCSIVNILHQDVFLVETSVHACANLFADIVRKKDISLENLMNQVALLRYIFAHACPYARGSAAIGEWLEMAIYRYFSYSCTNTLPGKQSVDILALTTLTYTEYLEQYRELVKLERV